MSLTIAIFIAVYLLGAAATFAWVYLFWERWQYTEIGDKFVVACLLAVIWPVVVVAGVREWWDRRQVEIRTIFAWYDLWVGAYWDRARRRLYVLPIPTLGFVLEFGKRPVAEPTPRVDPHWEAVEDEYFWRVRWSEPDSKGRYLWVGHYTKEGDLPDPQGTAMRHATRFNDQRKAPWEFPLAHREDAP